MTERKGNLIRKKYNEYLVSTLAMSTSIYLAAIVDSIMVGNILGVNALSAVSLTSPIVYAKNIVFSIFVYGGNTLAATYCGKRDSQSANKTFTFSIIFGIITSALLMAMGIFLAKPTVSWLSQDGPLYKDVYDYLIPLWVSGPLLVFSNGIAAYVRTDGMKKLASALPIVSNIINLFLDYVFMKVFHWGIAGAGWATVAGYALGSLLLIPYFMSEQRTVHFVKIGFSDLKILAELLKTGLASALIHICNFIRTAAVNSVILSAVGVVGMQIAAICLAGLNVALIFIQGSANTIMPICGALYGERDNKGLKYALRFALIASEVMCFIVLILFELFPLQLGRMFGKIPVETVSELKTAIRIFSVCIPFYGISYLIRAFYQSTKQRFAASVFTIVEGAAIIVPMIYIFSLIDIRLIWLSFGLSELTAIVLTVIILQIIAKRKGLSSFLMLDNMNEKNVLDMTISNTTENAVEISKRIFDFCINSGIEKKTATVLSVTAEELASNAAKFAYTQTGDIDICTRINENDLILRFRDSGIPFNPLEYKDDSGKDVIGLDVVRKLTPNITYNRVLGFNVTVVTVRQGNAKDDINN